MIQPSSTAPRCLFIPILALGAAILAPLSARAQIYTPFDQFYGTSNPSGSTPALFDRFIVGTDNGVRGQTASAGAGVSTTAQNQTLNLSDSATFPSFLGSTPVSATEDVSMTGAADYGVLTAQGSANVTASFSSAFFGNYTLLTAGQPEVQFRDTFTLNPAGYSAGDLVSVTFSDVFTDTNFSLSGPSTSNNGELVGLLNIYGQSSEYTGMFGESANSNGTYSPLPTPPGGVTLGGLSGLTTTLQLKVGETYYITGGLFLAGYASSSADYDEGTSGNPNSATIGATAYTLIDTGGLSYTTGSGTTYLTALPAAGVPDGASTAALLALAFAPMFLAARRQARS